MPLRDILKDAIDLAGKPISDRQFMTDFNRAANDLAMMYDTAKVHTTQTIVCTDTATEYSLTAGCFKIDRVLDVNGSYFKHYTVYANSKILFDCIGTYTVHGTFAQTPITAMIDTVSINAAFLKSIAEYVAAKAIKDTDTDRSKELMQDSAADAALANKNIRRATNPNKRVYVPSFR